MLMQVQNLAREVSPEPRWMKDVSFQEKKYRDPALFFQLIDYRQSRWHWHGDLFAYRIPSYAANSLPIYLGSRVCFGESIWQEPVLKSIEESDRICFRCDYPFWREHLEAVGYFVERCRGVELLGMTDFGGPVDWLAAFLGPEQLCLETVRQPEKVQAFAFRLGQIFVEMWEEVYARIAPYFDGTCNWLPMWAEGRLAVLQDDLSILFSPQTYQEVFVPVLRKIASQFEKVLFHFHNGALHQLDNLVSIPEITVLHFGIDPNTGPITHYLPQLRKVQKAGKGLFVSVLEPEDVLPLIATLDPRNLLLLVTTADDEASKKLLANAREWTQQRIKQMQD